MAIIGAAILPHPPLAVGNVAKEKIPQIQKTIDSFSTVSKEIKRLSPETIVLISSHAPLYSDYFHISPSKSLLEKIKGDFSRFGDSQTIIEAVYDSHFIDSLSELCTKESFPAGTLGAKDSSLDHGTMVPLYFIQKEYSDFLLVRIGLSGLSLAEHYELGLKIAKTPKTLNKKTFVLASGDLSHKLLEEGPYGWAKEGLEYDKKVMAVFEKASFGDLLVVIVVSAFFIVVFTQMFKILLVVFDWACVTLKHVIILMKVACNIHHIFDFIRVCQISRN